MKIKLVKKCSTVEEASTQVKKLSKIRWISLLLIPLVSILIILVGRLIPSLIPVIMKLTMFLLMIPIFAFLFTQLIFLPEANMEKSRLINITCPKCQTKYNLSHGVEYTFDDISSVSRTTENSVSVVLYETYKFRCTCPKCGEEKVFYSKFKCREGSANRLGSSTHGVDTESLIEEYFS